MIVVNFDVIAQPANELVQRVPRTGGMALWRILHEALNGRLAVVIDECEDTFVLETWMKVNGIKAAVYDVLYATSPEIKAEKVFALATAAGSSMTNWYVDVDPSTVEQCMKLGMTALLLADPYTVRPEWKNLSAAPRSWETLVEEVQKQKLERAERDWSKE